MKKIFVYFLTAVLTAISTVFALETLNASAEVENTIDCNCVSEVVYALRAGAASVRYSDNFVTVHYEWNPGIPEDTFYEIFAWVEGHADDFRDFCREIQRHGMSWDEYVEYCLEPYYTSIDIYGTDSTVMTL